MTHLLTLARTRISTIEIDHKLDGDTINLLPFLPKEHTFSFIIGSDQLPTFHLWGRWEELLEKMSFLVFPRYGFPNEPLRDHMRVVTNEFLVGTNLSSTKIRSRAHDGLSIDQFVPQKIAAYIRDHHLYR
jgi:nicotinate-nucleotide adenylyltransferase